MVAKKADTKKKDDTIAIPIPLEWHVPENTITPFASNMVVQIMEDVFKVSFFEVKPPIILDRSVPPPSKLRADWVASVFIAPDKLPKFIELLQKNYEAYMTNKEASKTL